MAEIAELSILSSFAHLQVNVFGVVAVTQAFLPLLKSAAKQGTSPRVVFVSSVVGSAAMAETAPYSSSKFAVQAIAVRDSASPRFYPVQSC
jgi:NAD(P)-dependent dehydrogenase (short-subunit alcohol dehydrogenase family)